MFHRILSLHLKVTVNPIPGAFVRKLRLAIWRRICRGKSTLKNPILFQQFTKGTKHFRVTQSSVIQGDSEGLKTVSEFSFVCLKGKKIGSKFYIFRQIATRKNLIFYPAFFVKCKQEIFFFWLRPCSVTSNALGNKATNSRKVVRSSE